ncbi:hypothetical protein ACQP1W_18845 [Spirillospora sp. CA-255316]
MAEVSAEMDDAIAAAQGDDGASWWARTDTGQWYPARILGFNLKSPTPRELLRSERFAAIGTFTDDRFIYTGFHLAPRPDDRPDQRTHQETRRERASYNDHVQRQQRRGELTARTANHEL